jgi:hypothetical protein
MIINGINVPPRPEMKFISKKADLPTQSGNTITLLNNYTYFFTTTVDLLGAKLVCGQNTTILGASSENCRIKSTGLGSGEYLISSVYSLPMRNITIEATSPAIALFLDGDNTVGVSGTTAIDWFGVNFTDCATIGTIRDYTNVIMTDCAFLNSAGLTFDGAIGSIGLSTCLFDGRTSSTTFTLASTLTITRRFRVIYSSFLTFSGETSINVAAAATIPNDAYILTYCNFAGGGTYLAGTTQSSLETLFINNVGIDNTSNVGHYYMQNNATGTGAVTSNVFVKAPGTTVVGLGNSPKWTTATTNRLTYAGTINSEFIATVSGAVLSGVAARTIGVGISKNGAQPDVESRVSVRCGDVSVPYPFQLQDVIQVATGNFFEIWIANEGNTNTITLQDVNVIIQKITG